MVVHFDVGITEVDQLLLRLIVSKHAFVIRREKTEQD